MGKTGKGFIFSLIALIFLSCQEEETTIVEDPSTLQLTSNLTDLLVHVTMSETSVDNVIDSSNCVEIQLPYSVSFNGLPIELTNTWAYSEFDSIPSGFYTGLVFPVTLVRPDHSTLIVNNQQEFDAAASDCSGIDDSVDCINLNYPITVYEYDSNNQLLDNYAFTNDAEFYSYLTNLQEGFYFSLEYPMSATYGNGETIEVNSNEELIAAINTSGSHCEVSPDPEPCIPIYLRSGLIAFYGFRNGSLNDEIGSMDLTNSGSVVSAPDRNGNPDCAMLFNYVTQTYLSSSNTTALDNLTGLSLSLWYQPATDLTDYEALISRGEGLQCPDRFGQWSVGLYDNRRAVFGAYNSAWSNVLSQQNTWYYLTATWTQSTGNMSIYINGQLQQTVTGLANCGASPVTVEDIGNLIIGRNYTGKIDDVAIYNRALIPSEIQALYGLSPCCGQ
ncbi:LamG domain-containing protein [Flavobacterium silvaticum]|uniref:LamG domain-containing protein n=1 Tax=Flavobacterium silvaticum TaxID=1852020 RepID=A0A972JJJ0_9FLAO|nr:LamG domain-containing protein [Flavobacterium silvaticum]NMH29413.1 LamG domain-containing protein [Flavobacterium silvaticum]